MILYTTFTFSFNEGMIPKSEGKRHVKSQEDVSVSLSARVWDGISMQRVSVSETLAGRIQMPEMR